MRLTDLSIKRLRVPEHGRLTYTDDNVRGFGVRVTSTGMKSFVVVVGRSRKRVTIGRYPTIKRTITFPGAATKNKRSHRIPFGARVEELLRRGKDKGVLFPGRGTDTAFDGWSKCKLKLDADCSLPHWTLHDLRRTFATNLAALGVPVHVTEKALNHVSGTMGGIVAVYQRHTYEKEIREAILGCCRIVNLQPVAAVRSQNGIVFRPRK